MQNKIRLNLFSPAVNNRSYGRDYRNHLFEQYRICVEQAVGISAQRQTANSYFLTINTALISAISLFGLPELSGVSDAASVSGQSMGWAVSVAGAALSYLWYRVIKSYKGLNTAKFLVIHEIESKLPIRPYHAEWLGLEEGKNPKLYHPCSHIELLVPWVFIVWGCSS